MAALPEWMTVAQFQQLPEGGEYAYELHYGEVVAVTHPSARHWKLQLHLRNLLQRSLANFGKTDIKAPYRPLSEFELRVADVATISQRRWDAKDADGHLRGAPELVIEVKSASNTPRELQELAALCLANGAIEFWVVDPDTSKVSVVGSQGTVQLYAGGSTIPLSAFGGGELAVDEIFASI